MRRAGTRQRRCDNGRSEGAAWAAGRGVRHAGRGAQRPIEAVDGASFDDLFALNVRGVYFTVQKALPSLSAGASVILTASVGAHVGAVGAAVYAATKAAVCSLGRSFGAELAPRGIRVNTLSPGPIDTPILGQSGVPLEAVRDMLRAMVPMGRMGTPLEAALAARCSWPPTSRPT